MDKLNNHSGTTHKENGSGSMAPFLFAGAVVMLGFFVWATFQVSGL